MNRDKAHPGNSSVYFFKTIYVYKLKDLATIGFR